MGADTPTNAPDALIGTLLAERYRLDELLGEGGMGKVYAAEHVLMKKRLAVKVLHRELCEVPDVVVRFEREAMATANIDHPNIAAATDCGKLADGSLFLVLELVQGKNLRDEVAAGPFAVPRALHIAHQIASALAAAHALDIVHRDLKPENVMLVTRRNDDDVVKVLDFGIAKLPAGPSGAAPLTRIGVVFGTPEYMSPEQALGQSVDARTDLYALGVITYELMCGLRPFTGASDAGILGQQLAKPVPPFAERAPGIAIPHQVEQVVHKLLAKDVASRYQTAEEVVQALEALLEPAPGEARLFTLPDGSATAVLGTADRMYAPAAPAPQLPPAPPTGPGGTLALLDDESARQLAARVAEARAVAPPLPPGASRGRSALERLVAAAKRAFTDACDYIDTGRPRLPEPVRRALGGIPAATILGVAMLLVWVPALVGVVWLVHPRKNVDVAAVVSRGEAAPSGQMPAADPVLREIDVAKGQGRPALEKLADAHPKHPRVWLALAASETEASAHSDAVAALGKALALDSKLADTPTASLVVAVAARKRESADAAFSLLEGPMGATGAALAYDLSIDLKAPASLRARALRWVVLSPEFLETATPPVEVAAKLRYAKSCSDRHALLPRAGKVGDARALAYIAIMKIQNGCGRRGRDDCFPCLRRDDALQQASAAIKMRQGE